MAFISITDGRVGRFDSQVSPNISGFYTDNFSSCNIIILYSKNAGNIKLSLIHGDQSITPDDIAEELSWINDDACMKINIRREDNQSSESRMKAIFGDYIALFDQQHCPSDKHGISIDIHGTVNMHSNYNNLPELIIHPDELNFTVYYKLNLMFLSIESGLNKLEYQKIIFDSEQWQELQVHDFNFIDSANEYFSSIQAGYKDSLDRLDAQDIGVKDYFKYECSNRMASIFLGLDAYIIAEYSMQLLAQHNFSLIIQNRIKKSLRENNLNEDECNLLNSLTNIDTDEIYETMKSFSDDQKAFFFRIIGGLFFAAYHSTQKTILPAQNFFESQQAQRDTASSAALIESSANLFDDTTPFIDTTTAAFSALEHT